MKKDKTKNYLKLVVDNTKKIDDKNRVKQVNYVKPFPKGPLADLHRFE
jgi:hypothetical protein